MFTLAEARRATSRASCFSALSNVCELLEIAATRSFRVSIIHHWLDSLSVEALPAENGSDFVCSGRFRVRSSSFVMSVHSRASYPSFCFLFSFLCFFWFWYRASFFLLFILRNHYHLPLKALSSFWELVVCQLCSFCASSSITGLQVHEAIEVVEVSSHPPNSGTEVETSSFDFYVIFSTNSSDFPRSQRRIMKGKRTEILLNLKRKGPVR